MVRLTRAQQQERNRAAVLAAAHAEFTACGYGDAKIDRIAARAELTRGAVYSNFPSKRALYLAVLLDAVRPGDPAPPAPDLAAALGAFTRSWLERLPLTGDTAAAGGLRLRSLTGVFDDEPGRVVLAEIAKLEALLLGLALESGPPHRTGTRRVRLAELVLTLLAGARAMAETAPGFGDPFDVTRACQHLADLDLDDTWQPPHLPFVAPAHPVQEDFALPGGLSDLVSGEPVEAGDGVLAVLGVTRLGAAEEVVRGARDGDQVTVVVVTSDQAEWGRLVQLRVRDLVGCLAGVGRRPRLRVVVDDSGAVAAALGVRDGDDTEAAVRLHRGEIVARASWRGAGHAAATAAGSARTRR